ncbi:MAG: S16 family serine protease [Candidatus Nanoarchaeia archaeon]|jgi:uncharacterized protein
MRRLLLLLPLLLTPVLAGECSTVLVGVMETSTGYEGVLANLTVMTSNGTGNVWVDTMPLTMIETQVSARLAQEVACDLLNLNCSTIDFFFVLRSEHSMVGGPSAGGAMAVCAMAALLEKPVYSDVAMTGTINPDGSIGPVGAVGAKAMVVDDYHYFLVPEDSPEITGELNVEVVGVRDVVDALKYYTGYELVLGNVSNEELVNDDYVSAMRLMSESLLSEAQLVLNGSSAGLLLNQSLDYYNNMSYYSSASYSVQSLIESYYAQYVDSDVEAIIDLVSQDINDFKTDFLSSIVIDHLYDLESFAITMERISEAEQLVDDSRLALLDDPIVALGDIAFAKARLVTAVEWSSLLDYFSDSKVISFNVNSIRSLVIERLEFARNSITYAQTIIEPLYLVSAQEHLNQAVSAYNNGDLVYSLFESLKSRAEANLMMEVRGMENVSSKIDFKREAAQRAISNAMTRGFIPLMALSYLEYADAFDDAPYQALTFLAYSREFSSLGSSINDLVGYDSGFNVNYSLKRVFLSEPVNQIFLIIIGFIIGLIVTLSRVS